MIVGRTTRAPKSALHYELDKARYLDLETCSIPVLFSQNFFLPELKLVIREFNVLLRSLLKNEIDVQYSLLLQYEILEKLVT